MRSRIVSVPVEAVAFCVTLLYARPKHKFHELQKASSLSETLLLPCNHFVICIPLRHLYK